MEKFGNQRPDIEYPNDWKYKIIGDNIEIMITTIDDLLLDKFKYEVSPSNISKKGNYFSLNLVVTVENELERNYIYSNLQANENIKFVI